ncbi:MAG: hypothetical protein ACKVP5_08750 [Aestuariivirga sp.]
MLTHQMRPTKGTQTGRVWEIADSLSRSAGRRAKRQEVIEAYVREGGNPNTASTQYSSWKKSFVEPRGAKPALPLDVKATKLQIASDGRLLLPLEVRDALRLGDNQLVTVEVKDGVLTLMSPATALIKIRNIIKQHDTSKGSVVDELIAERRAEARRE